MVWATESREGIGVASRCWKHFSVLHETKIRCATEGITSEYELGVLALKLSSTTIDFPFSANKKGPPRWGGPWGEDIKVKK